MPGIASLGASSMSRRAVSSRLQGLARGADLARGRGEAELDSGMDVSGLVNNIYLSRRADHGLAGACSSRATRRNRLTEPNTHLVGLSSRWRLSSKASGRPGRAT